MARVAIIDKDCPGFAKDTPKALLPPEAWTTATGVRFQDGIAERFGGPTTLALPSSPLALQVFGYKPYDLEFHLILADAAAVKITDGITTTTITGTSVPAATANSWTYTNFNGIPILNDGGTIRPQALTTIPGGPLVNLPNWPATYLAASVRSFKNFLIALNIKKGATQHPNLVLWSDAADPGSVPGSWDVANPAVLAGENPLANNDDDDDTTIVDGLSLRSFFMIYKHTSAHVMRLGGQNIFSFDQVFGKGAMNRNCISALSTGEAKHVVIGIDDIYVHNGYREDTILERKLRRWFFDQIDPAKSNLVHSIHYPLKKELYFCYPPTGATRVDKALVWNYVSNSFSVVDIANTHSLTSVPFATPDPLDTWDADDVSWDAADDTWDALAATALRHKLIQVLPTGFNFLDAAAPSATATLERLGLAIAGRDQAGTPIYDTESVKQVIAMWPRFEGSGIVSFIVGGSDTIDGTIRWDPQGPQPFNVASQDRITCSAHGRVLHVRFTAVDMGQWRMLGYDLDINLVGGYSS